MRPSHAILCLAALALASLSTGCESLVATPTPTPAPTPTATMMQAIAPQPRPSAAPTLLPSPAATVAPTGTIAPAPMPTQTPLWPSSLCIEPEALWTVLCPATLRTAKLDDRLTLLANPDRGVLIAIDSYMGTAGEVGNTGEGLRNRARTALTRVYGQGVKESEVLQANYPWQTGVTFATAAGTRGEAVYAQPGRDRGNYRVYGFIFSYKAADEKAVRPMLEAVRDSFKPVTALQLQVPAGGEPLWALFSTGLRTFNLALPDEHFLAVFGRSATGWQERARVLLGTPDYVDPAAVRQVPVEPTHLWLTVDGAVGAHSGTFQLLSYRGGALKLEVESSNSRPGAGSVMDLNGDGTMEAILDQADHYVFCYACGVRYPHFGVLRWDGTRFVEVQISRLPDTTPEEVRSALNRAIVLAQAGLWKDARAAADQAPKTQDPAATWDVAIIRLHADAFAELAREGTYPLLENAFYGDYAAALAIMSRYAPAQIFDPKGPLLVGTPAEGWEGALAVWVERITRDALAAEPELAAAYYLRGWAALIAEPGNAQAVADVEHAAQLEPQEALYRQSLAHLRVR